MRKWFEPWEIIAAIICAVVSGFVLWTEYRYDCLTSRYPLLYSGILGLVSGVIGTVTVFWLQRWRRAVELHARYHPLAGTYTRKDIGQDNAEERELQRMQTENNGLQVELIYDGQNAFTVTASYWKSVGAVVKARLEFIDSNKMVATGRYRYIEGKELIGHFGTYTVYRADENGTELLVQYQHLFPRSNDTKPDSNRGWEVWSKSILSA